MTNIRSWLAILSLVAACTESTQPFDPRHDEVVLTAASPTSVTVAAGNGVTDLPTVIAQDRNGTPQPGVIVSFTVVEGSSMVFGIRDTTDASGMARLGGWGPAPKAGQRSSILATTANGDAVRFSATVVPAAPAKILKVAGDNQIAASRADVVIRPRLQVTDAYLNAVPGVHVTFEVIKGGGSIAPGEVLTDSAGTVTLSSWTLGNAGDQLLIATAGNLAESFHAIAIDNLAGCSQELLLSPVAALGASFNAQSCSENSRYYTIYYLKVTGSAAWLFEMHSTAFDSYLELRDASSNRIASNDDGDVSTRDSRMTVMLNPGLYQLVAVSDSPGAFGTYSLAFMSPGSAAAHCDGMFVVRGVSVGGQLIPATCHGAQAPLADVYRIRVLAGTTLEIDLRDWTYSGFDLDILDDTGQPLAKGHQTTDYLTYSAAYRADRDMDLVVKVSSIDTFAEYTISFR